MSSVPPTSGRSVFGLDARVAAMLTYTPFCVFCFGAIFSLLVVAMEKHNRSVRFHALQSLLLHAGLVAVSIVMWVLRFILGAIADVLGFLGLMIHGMILLGVFAILVLLMVKTYAGEEIEMPFFGELARKWL
jgi:uncharacterized membrane protein